VDWRGRLVYLPRWFHLAPRLLRLTVMLRALPLLLLAAFLFGCASGGSSAPERHSLEEGIPTRVTFVDYRNGVRMTLVNEAHTDPVELYSEIRERSTATTKVVSNEVMTALMTHFAEKGFDRYAERGFAPATPRGGELQSLEVERPGEVQSLATYGHDTAAEHSFRECRLAFLQAQELTMQFQAVRNDGSDVIFEQPKRSEKRHGN